LNGHLVANYDRNIVANTIQKMVILLQVAIDNVGDSFWGVTFIWKVGGTKNRTCGAHRARRRSKKIFEIFCAEWCIFIFQPYSS